jgi:hypothetical protein
VSFQTFGAETRVARKPHICAYCLATIQKGSAYHRWASADEGTVVTVVAHSQCIDLWRQIDPGADEIPMEPYEFRQDCHAYGGPGPFPWELRS